MKLLLGNNRDYLVNEKYWYKLLGIGLIIIIFALYFLYVAILFIVGAGLQIGIGLGIGFIGIYILFSRRINKTIKKAKNYKNGNCGEDIVENSLRILSDEYTVIRSVIIPGAKSDIDFVVIGPSGIFVLEAKSHSGSITFHDGWFYKNGIKVEKNFYTQTYSAKKHLEEYIQKTLGIKLSVIPYIVFSRASINICIQEKEYKGVSIMGSAEVVNNIQGVTSQFIGKEMREKIVDVLVGKTAGS